ncbi:stage III sporulation protein SpoIIIAB [Thermosediminibacter oceani]|uniref:Stage III sporulation protein AB n=1 Tax=Thermosediminibacter oceani (strain ATCC BAA-1034 / DSM 16646 / JW/IW-1228P) TaxID=555079 RepID=D9RXK2_THEOJ|nr:stage III sporulation protein SpoIIIAB [Thermosediminibacter oceani]ADL08076.1 stage III sporulation protein AB [Thermosediminibacter oceani DSM 16646]
MLFKILGAILVIFSSTMIGFIIAGYYQQRPRTLRNLQQALSMLETEIDYGQTPLPEALKNVSRSCDPEISKFLERVRQLLLSIEGFTAGEAWEKSLREFRSQFPLQESDFEILTSFGKYLGSSDKDDQIRNLKLTLSQLRQQEVLAVEEKQKNEKMWRYLGVLTGLTVVLLLY